MTSAILLASCSGTGGVSVIGDDEETYGGSGSVFGASSGSSAGGMTDSSGGELSAWDIMNMMDSGHADEVEAILSGVAEEEVAEERGFFEVSFTAEELGLPEGGYVELEILGGGADFKDKAYAGADGKVRFSRVPRQDVGATVSIALTVYNSEDCPLCSANKTSSVEAGGTTAFKMPLVDLPRITIDITGSKTSYGRTVEQSGVTYEVLEYTGSGLGMNVTNTDSEATMEIKLNDADCTESENLSDGFNKIEVTSTKSETLPTVTVRKNIYVVKALSEDDIELTFPNGTEASSNNWQYRYSQYDNLQMTVTNNYTGDNANTGEHSSIKVAVSSTVTNSDGTTSSSSAEYTDNTKVENKELEDGSHSLTITLSKPNCEDVKLTKSITSKMKPIKVYVRDGHVYIKFEKSGNLTMRGTLHIGVNPHGQCAYSFWTGVDTSGTCSWLEIRNLVNCANPWKGDVTDDGVLDRSGDVYIYNKDDKLCYKTENLIQANGSYFKGIKKLDFVPNLKSTEYDMSVSVWTDDDTGHNCPHRIGNGANSIHTVHLGLDDGY